jgi:fructuronate reductase
MPKRAGEPDLARWIGDAVAVPCTMVDRITPATDDALRAEADQTLGLRDAWPIQREPFAQWVIEDGFASGADADAFAAASVTLTRDVVAHEHAAGALRREDDAG